MAHRSHFDEIWAVRCGEWAISRPSGRYMNPSSEGDADMTSTTTTDVFSLSIPDAAWRAVGDPADSDEGRTADERSLLMVAVTINGTFHHLVAYEVSLDEDGVATPADEDKSEEIDNYYVAAGADGSFDTTTIGDREYVVVMTPFD
jgi:hypothetical protein